ncbi:type-2 angiotensin II receptor-like [Osmerus eperlanus]|uniref:type-2 angiotensin II receptor-like n=1 Tax=Osmerus eperlanus TaxID=29151 RepID=UPI002E11690F
MENNFSLLNATHSFYTPTTDNPSSPTTSPPCPAWPSLAQNILIPSLYGIICALGIVGNTLALCLLAQAGGGRRTVANTFMLNLCVSDLLFLLSLPLWAVYYSLGYHWPFGWLACKLCGGLLSLNLYASIFFITCMSVDRYLAIVRPLHAQGTRDPRRAQRACVLVWVLAFASSAPTLVLRDTRHVEELGVEACVILYPHHGWFLSLAWMKMLLGFLLPMAIITSCYCAIARHLMLGGPGLGVKRGADSKAHQSTDNFTKADSSPRLPVTSLGQEPPVSSDRRPSVPCSVRPLEGRGLERVLWTVAAVVLAFFLCWFPFHLLTLLDVLQSLGVVEECWAHWALATLLPLSLSLGFSNSAINPVLYCFLGKHFRGRLGGMWEGLCVCVTAQGEARVQKRGSFSTRLSSFSRKQSETSGPT